MVEYAQSAPTAETNPLAQAIMESPQMPIDPHRRKRMAQALRGDYSPVKHPAQGWARLLEGFSSGLDQGLAMRDENAAFAQDQAGLASAARDTEELFKGVTPAHEPQTMPQSSDPPQQQDSRVDHQFMPQSTSPVNTASNFFGQRGYDPNAVAGIVANLRYESGEKLNPLAMNNSGTETGGAINPRGAFGIAQWNGPRQADLLQFAGDPNRARMLDTQLAFVAHELQKRGLGPDAFKGLSPDRASYLVTQKYEVPKDIRGAHAVRAPYASMLAAKLRGV